SFFSAQHATPAMYTPSLHDALPILMPWLTDGFGNASSVHRWGRAARRAIDEARERVAAAIGCRPGEIVFTSGGTEADNLALKGRSEEHTSELQSRGNLVCRLLLEKK